MTIRSMIPGVCAVSMALVFAGCASSEETARALYDEALEARDRGQLAESDALLQALLTEVPEGPVADQARSLLETVRSESEARVLEAMTAIRVAQEDFMARERRHAQSVEELVSSRMLAEAPNGPAIGYRIRTRSSPAADAYSIMAEPTEAGEARHSFFQDLDGVMRWELGGPATAESPPVE